MPVAKSLCSCSVEVLLYSQISAVRLPHNLMHTKVPLGLPCICRRGLQYMLNRHCSLCTTADTYVTHPRALVDDSATK
jgi:hypothetical protein